MTKRFPSRRLPDRRIADLPSYNGPLRRAIDRERLQQRQIEAENSSRIMRIGIWALAGGCIIVGGWLVANMIG